MRGAPAVGLRVSTRADGDFHLDQRADDLDARRRRLVDLPWTQPDEVHGTTVVEVGRPGEHDRAVADAAVTGCAGAVLGVWVGDCAPVALAAGSGRIGAVHAGWRGIAAGVLEAAVRAVRRDAADPVRAWLGPCIHPCCYEFAEHDLAPIADRLGPSVRGRTRAGRPALDVPAAVRAALAPLGVEVARPPLPAGATSWCTGCDERTWFSHRVRGERGRQVLAVWRHPAGVVA